TQCTLHIGAISFFRGDTLEFFWRDPEHAGEPIPVPDPDSYWQSYYSPLLETYRSRAGALLVRPTDVDVQGLTPIAELDLSIGIHPTIASLLLASNWRDAREAAKAIGSELAAAAYKPDGIIVKAGPSWLERRH